MSEELKRCPFCGGEAEYSTLEDEWGVVSHFVTCPNNCIEGLWSRDVSKEKAIKAWNNRPSPWHTGIPTEKGVSLILHIMSNEDDIEGYYQSGYYEQNRWFKWNGCGIALDCGEYVDKWAYEKDFVVA